MFPSWETLPHERLSPSVDTVGARVEATASARPTRRRLVGSPLRVIVTTARSLVQPMAPDLARLEPMTFRVGIGTEFDLILIARLVDMAYTRVDMVGKRGEFAVRGGILDVFSPTADHPVRIEFLGDEVSELRLFAVADQRSLPEVDVEAVIAVPCREVILTADVRGRAAELPPSIRWPTTTVSGGVPDMLDKLGRGHPRRRDGSAAPGVASHRDLATLSALLPAGAPSFSAIPRRCAPARPIWWTRVSEFLEASWTTAAMGGDSPSRSEGDGSVGFPPLTSLVTRGPRRRSPVVDGQPAVRRVREELDIRTAP